MEKLTIEQKAMAYDKAIKVANKYKDTSIMFPSIQDEMFPELKKSEDADEKVRKALIKLVTNHASMDLFIEYDIHLDEALSWLEKQGEKVTSIEGFETEFERQVSRLIASVINREHEYNEGFVKWSANALLNYAKHELEKQGEQKSTDKTEPKFKVGDWIVYKDNIWKICNISLGAYYELLKVDGEVIIRHFEGVDKTAHLWTVKDAKDGDVLVGGEQVFLFKRMNTSNSFYAHCNYHFIGYDSLSVYDCSYSIDNICPATKKQRDVLMKTIADAGYTFDFEKKELKMVGQKPVEWSADDLPEFESYLCLMFQKFRTKGVCTNGEIVDFVKEHSQKLKDTLCHTWSKKDEEMHRKCICAMRASACGFPEEEKFVEQVDNWLKLLKDRVQPQQKQEWSKEDKDMINTIISDLKRHGGDTTYSAEVDWLEQFQPKQEWSEKDEVNSNICIRLMKTHSLCDKNIITWFNSLKYRVKHQNSSITNEELEQAKKDAYNDALDKIEYHSGEPTFADGWHAAIDYIKKKSFKPNLQWKPSDEQITWLYRAADDASKDSRMKQVLNNLLSDLKKLREK